MGKVNSLWQTTRDDILNEFVSGAADEETTRHRLRQFGLDCDDAENEIEHAKLAM